MGQSNKETAAPGLISGEEMRLAESCMAAALRSGADQVRVSLGKSVLDSYSMLNGVLDKVSHSADRSIFLYVFADNRYGTFSTNMLDEAELAIFAERAVKTVGMLSEDRCRRLPDPSLTALDAVSGREAGLYDIGYGRMDTGRRLAMAEGECIFGKCHAPEGCRVISEECEYSDSVDDNYLIDSNGFAGRHTETSFAVCSEITVEDRLGNKYSGYWWDSSPFLATLKLGRCSAEALARAVRQIGPESHEGGRMKMVVDASVSSRLVSPLLSALNASSIQQENSFLKGSEGKEMFCRGLTITDAARTPGKPGSRLFDTEGVATEERDIIRQGKVGMYFTNTYMALKMGIRQTIESASRPVLMPYRCDGGEIRPEAGSFGAKEIIGLCGDGIYVTGFNGGNCNSTTGDFSYGIEGFLFKDGEIRNPVREMLITGNMVQLWNSLLYAGNDARECTRWQIPALCFEKVDFSG